MTVPTFGRPDERDDTDRLKDLRRVHQQVMTLLRTRQDDALEQRLVEHARDRRATRDVGVPFEPIADKHGERTLAVSEQLLIRRRSLKDPSIQGLMRALDLREGSIDGPLGERVVRLMGPNRSMRELGQLASTLRRAGLSISANYVTPMEGFVKSVTGPELSSGLPPTWPADEVPKRRRRPSVRVAVIDTGFRPHDGSFPWLSNIEQTKQNREVLDARPLDEYLDLASGHGTFCTGVVQQVAPSAEIVVYKAVESDGFSDEVQVAQRIITAASEGLARGQHVVITLSVGAETADDERPVAFSAALEIVDELARAADLEVLVVAAAGNFGHDRPCYPAAFPSVTAVAATTQGLLPAEWSSRGAWVDVCTIGEGVRSTFVQGTESPVFDPMNETFKKNAWALWTGTSFAAPQVAGAIASIAIRDEVPPSEAKRTLLADAPEVPLYGKRVEILAAIAPRDAANGKTATKRRRFRKS